MRLSIWERYEEWEPRANAGKETPHRLINDGNRGVKHLPICHIDEERGKVGATRFWIRIEGEGNYFVDKMELRRPPERMEDLDRTSLNDPRTLQILTEIVDGVEVCCGNLVLVESLEPNNNDVYLVEEVSWRSYLRQGEEALAK